jgi:predicted nucleic acid-binding protein
MKGGADLRYVLDASVAASWCFEDEFHPIAEIASALLLSSASAATPLIFWFELRNVLLAGMRRGRISQYLLTESLVRVGRAPIKIEPLPDDEPILALAIRHRLTFYDATYLELAQRERIALATLDQALARAATAENVSLIGV